MTIRVHPRLLLVLWLSPLWLASCGGQDLVLESARSPDGTLDARVVVGQAGAMASDVLHVVVRPRSRWRRLSVADDSAPVFSIRQHDFASVRGVAAESLPPGVPRWLAKNPMTRVHATWLGDGRLRIQYPAGSRPLRQHERVAGHPVLYDSVAGLPVP